MLNGLDLFSGIGGIGIALKSFGIRTVTYCEQDRFAQSVLLSRMQSGDIDRAPIWDDVRKLTKELLPDIDVIFGGFPCQDISVAGAGKGLDGERSGLFFEIIRLTKEIRPAAVFLENVPAIRTRGLEQVIKAFTEVGYDCRWTTITASSIGAHHKRERWFFLAYAQGERIQGLRACGEQESHTYEQQELFMRESEAVPNAKRSRLQIRPGAQPKAILGTEFNDRKTIPDWPAEPDVGRVVDGLQHRTHRIKCLGNSVVPQQVAQAFKMLTGFTYEKTS